MLDIENGQVRIKLIGDWSITGVTNQLKSLTEHLAKLPSASAAATDAKCAVKSPSEIDMGEIDAFDACGCQLLTVFLRHLRLLGYTPQLVNTPAELADHIITLGFAHEFDNIMDAAKGHA